MKAVILAGGLGTRLRPMTDTIPKPMVDVQGKTLTEHVFDILKRANIRDVYLSICYLADKVQAYYGDGRKFGMNIKYLVEKEPMGTGGWMTLLREQHREDMKEDLFVINGDDLFDISPSEVYASHKKSGAAVTIALTKVDDVSQYGIADIKDGRIVRFVEKPKPEEAPSNYANSGYYVFSPAAFNYMPGNRSFMLEKDLFPQLAEKGLLAGFKSGAQWFDTGTFDRLKQVNENWLRK